MTNAVEILKRNAAIIEPKTGIEYKLSIAQKENRPLVVKLGFDPTAPDLHLGHAVVLQKMRDFQDLGHRIVVIIGDFTARIGDPTGRNKTRPPLEAEQIIENAKTYVNHLAKVLDTSKIEVRYNSEWLDKMGMADLLKLMAKVTVAQIIQREDFKNRLADNTPIGMHELLYPLMQGSDSVAIDADIELGGTDQLFNNLMGRTLQEAHGKQGQVVMVMPLLVGLDGVEKMSKSKHNYIALTDSPEDMFGKVMSIGDAQIENYLTLGTTLPAAQVAEIMSELKTSPMNVKKRTAFEIVKRFHGDAGAATGQEHFERNVQNRDTTKKDYKELQLSALGLAASASVKDIVKAIDPALTGGDIKRLISGGGISINDGKATDPNAAIDLSAEVVIKIGKLDYYKVLPN